MIAAFSRGALELAVLSLCIGTVALWLDLLAGVL